MYINTVWIDKEFCKWDAQSEGGSIMPLSSLKRTYELWNHADDILLKHSTNNYLSDAISNLNRAIGMRIKTLNENYHFNSSPFKTKDKKYIASLKSLELLDRNLLMR